MSWLSKDLQFRHLPIPGDKSRGIGESLWPYMTTDEYKQSGKYTLAILNECARYANTSEGWRVFDAIKADSDYVLVEDTVDSSSARYRFGRYLEEGVLFPSLAYTVPAALYLQPPKFNYEADVAPAFAPQDWEVLAHEDCNRVITLRMTLYKRKVCDQWRESGKKKMWKLHAQPPVKAAFRKEMGGDKGDVLRFATECWKRGDRSAFEVLQKCIINHQFQNFGTEHVALEQF